jgi:hypothetical protein|tara:strand:+ start:490 stop:702 length:213 start_codon:yes stop_codon:yes gene_type:complete
MSTTEVTETPVPGAVKEEISIKPIQIPSCACHIAVYKLHIQEIQNYKYNHSYKNNQRWGGKFTLILRRNQ